MTETRSTLLARLRQSRDEASWSEFVALYEPLLHRYSRSRGLGEEDSRDVVQAILASLVERLPEFELDRARGRFRSWLWRVTQNAIADWARRQKRRKAAEQRWLELRGGTVSEPEAEWDDAYRRRVLEFSLERVRERSQPKTWECFERHVLRGALAEDVAAEFDLAVGTVYANASRTLARIRDQCSEYAEDWDEIV